MDGPNFDPVVGEEVRVRGQSGLYKIVDVSRAVACYSMPAITEGEFAVSLKREGRNTVITGVPWSSLQYVDETRDVRRTIEWLKTSPENRKYPSYIVDYEVKAGEDHVGRPSIFVRFFIDSDYLYQNGRASEEKVVALNEFLDSVRDELSSLELDRWISVRVGEARRTLDVAS